ncbi:hypothetical protein [Amycolatopsis silviterrae]|uniref:Secreted protein n=1 Tax=Amycolatopsis silviterrae TaxID=1656914 RepID=A0ABW5H2M3_9PSEU
MNAGAVVALAVVALAVVIGLAARGRKQMDLEQWTVAGRSYGTLLFWVIRFRSAVRPQRSTLSAKRPVYAQRPCGVRRECVCPG